MYDCACICMYVFHVRECLFVFRMFLNMGGHVGMCYREFVCVYVRVCACARASFRIINMKTH